MGIVANPALRGWYADQAKHLHDPLQGLPPRQPLVDFQTSATWSPTRNTG